MQAVIERTIEALGYELVDIEHGAGGLLRVLIDYLPGTRPAGAFIRIEDCERVSHQLTHVLTVEEIDYARLEVSSPGLDRPLKKAADFDRFAGNAISLKLKRALDGRRNFQGQLTVEGAGRYGLTWSDAPAPSGVAASKGRRGTKAVRPAKAAKTGAVRARAAGSVQEGTLHQLVFTIDEVDRARLVPEVNFSGHKVQEA